MVLVSFVFMVLLLYNPLFSVMERVIIANQLYFIPMGSIVRVTGLETVLVVVHLLLYSTTLWGAIYFALRQYESWKQPVDLKRAPPYDVLTLIVGGNEILGGKRLVYATKPYFVMKLAIWLARLVNLYFGVFILLSLLVNLMRLVPSLNSFAASSDLLSVVLPVVYSTVDPSTIVSYMDELDPSTINLVQQRLPQRPLLEVQPSLIALALLVPIMYRRWMQERRHRYDRDLGYALYRHKHNQNEIKV